MRGVSVGEMWVDLRWNVGGFDGYYGYGRDCKGWDEHWVNRQM